VGSRWLVGSILFITHSLPPLKNFWGTGCCINFSGGKGSVEPKWLAMASNIHTSLEANINTLMNVADEALWQAKGLFEKADSMVVGTDNLTPSSVKQFPPPNTRSFLSSGLAPSFEDFLPGISGVSQTAEKRCSTQTREEVCKVLFHSSLSRKAGKGAGNSGISRRLWKAKKTVHKMVMGSYVGLAETCRLVLCGLVGRLSYMYLCKVSLSDWVEHTWRPRLGYVSEIVFLTKGWFGFICNMLKDSTQLLTHRWVIGGCSLMIKRWRVSFNPETDYFQHRHLWVLLLGLPLQLWNAGALEAIGNSLGSFISLGESVLSAPNRKMGKILVEMDIHGGLPKIIEIEWRGRRIVQKLDYLGIPFPCSNCRNTKHLRRDCSGWDAEEISEDTTLHKDNGDLAFEVDSAWVGTRYPSIESLHSSERDDLISGKLKLHCPSLYDSLTLWEKEELNASLLLKNVFSSVEVPSGVVKKVPVNDPLGFVSLFNSVTPSSRGKGESSILPPGCLGILPVLETLSTRPPSLVDHVLPPLSSSVDFSQVASPTPVESVPIPGCRESEEDDTSLSAVLDSLIPYLRDNNPPTKLPTYFGNAIFDPSTITGEISTTTTILVETTKDYSWSRGLGIEYSPIKTRST
jgi:hypothetical protein